MSLKELLEKEEITPVKYDDCEEGIDIITVLDNTNAICVVPISKRAIALFVNYWGYEDEGTGIFPPESVDDLTNSIPEDWILGSASPKPGAHVLQEIALPRDIPVLH